jgi:threonine dehydrogenase-like Zn-dependent dehydrogenase
MRALWLEDRELRVREDVPRPTGETLVKVRLAGICNTDLELTRGYYPYTGVPGHEFVGEDEQGRRVVGEINVACHACATCARGDHTHCERRTVLGIVNRNGAFAEYASLPAENLHPVPDEVTDEEAVFTEPLAAALEIQQQVAIGPGQRVVVLGDGKLGNLVAQTLALTGCVLTVVGRHEAKLELLEKRGIATGTPEARRADVVVECTGQAAGFDEARRLVRPRGTIVLKSTYAGDLTLNMSSVVVDEVTIVGSRCGPFAPALELLKSRKVDVKPLIEARFPLAEAVEAFAEAGRRGALKVLIDTSSNPKI